MDGVKIVEKNGTKYLRFWQPVDDFIEVEQPRMHLNCDWIGDPLALGILIYPREIYEKMEALKHGRTDS